MGRLVQVSFYFEVGERSSRLIPACLTERIWEDLRGLGGSVRFGRTERSGRICEAWEVLRGLGGSERSGRI